MGVSVFKSNALDVHPLRWTREAGGIVPDELLAEGEFSSFEKREQRLERQSRHGWLALLPCIAQLDDNRPLGPEQDLENVGKPGQPLNVGVAFQISILFLSIKRKRRGRENQVNVMLEACDDFRGLEDFFGLTLKADSESRAVSGRSGA